MSADEIFEELRYKKKTYGNIEQYEIGREYIEFDKEAKAICTNVRYLIAKELQAINKKCEELGWI